jgi:peroxiredoxin
VATVGGESIRLADLRGKVVLLNFWTTGCVPCRAELPSLEALYRQYRERGLEVLAISLGPVSRSEVEALGQNLGVTFRIALDPSGSAAKAYRIVSLPTTFVIDRAGNAVARELNARNWTDRASQTAVLKLLE